MTTFYEFDRKVDTAHYEVSIDTPACYGYFEHHTRGYLDGMAKGRRDAAMDAEEGQEPVAYYVERHAPGMRDHSTKLGPFWKREDAEGWLDEHHQMHALYTHPQPCEDCLNRKTQKLN